MSHKNSKFSENPSNYRYMSKVFYKNGKTIINLYVNKTMLAYKNIKIEDSSNIDSFNIIEYDNNGVNYKYKEKDCFVLMCDFSFNGGSESQVKLIEDFINKKANSDYFEYFTYYEKFRDNQEQLLKTTNKYKEEDYKIDDISEIVLTLQKDIEEKLKEPLEEFEKIIESIFVYFNSNEYQKKLDKQQSEKLNKNYVNNLKKLQSSVNSNLYSYHNLKDIKSLFIF